MTALLTLDAIEVDFDGFKALSGLSFTLNQGEVRFLIGPNGAGKTTAVDVITGLTRPSAGTVTFAGDDITGRSEFDIVKLGMAAPSRTRPSLTTSASWRTSIWPPASGWVCASSSVAATG